ncbi:tetraacyldisaccharide 4'-kinase [Sphingobacterium corticis]|uniref:Tetraacyldisaccharide 4'-kinase n=1 Tax=Sphingobacterium corticis TaxID=1812823 RepID=A0ABW5NHA8_9SPHI
MIRLLRWLLLPITAIYAMAVWLRNKLYDWQIFKSKIYPISSIVVGNLAVGGTGKTPMIECLVRWFGADYRIATLSRGYGRKTKGFRYVEVEDDATQTGDEPLQFKRKFPHLTVAVSEDRRIGMEQLSANHDLILLDDAFQHRRVKAKCNILLFEYASFSDFMLPLPTGNFRDLLPQAKRAHAIVVTKTPSDASESDRDIITKRLRKYTNAPIYFASISYGEAVCISDETDRKFDFSDMRLILVTGIANPKPLIEYLEKMSPQVKILAFSDHHHFTDSDYQQIRKTFQEQSNLGETILITTEKDAQRLAINQLPNIPSFYIPIQFAFDQEQSLRKVIINTLQDNNVNEH